MIGATKRNSPGNKLPTPTETTGVHYMHFIIDTMDIMDKFPDIQGCHIVMVNASIHVPNLINPIIKKRGCYIPVYLSPYSPGYSV